MRRSTGCPNATAFRSCSATSQGFTCEEAARRMGRPVGTVKSWRFRGRERLRDRLIRLRLAPSVALGGAFPLDAALTTVPQGAVRTAVRALSDWMTAGEVSASVRTLVEGVLKTMLLQQVTDDGNRGFRSGFAHRRPRRGRVGGCGRFERTFATEPRPPSLVLRHRRPVPTDFRRPQGPGRGLGTDSRRSDPHRPGECRRSSCHLRWRERNALQDRAAQPRRRR